MDETYRGLLALAGLLSIFFGIRRIAIGPTFWRLKPWPWLRKLMRFEGFFLVLWGVASLYVALTSG